MTDFLSQRNTKSVENRIQDYREISEKMESAFAELNGKQLGDPRKGVNVIKDIVKGENKATGRKWPSTLPLGSDAVDAIRKKCESTLREIDEWQSLSTSTNL